MKISLRETAGKELINFRCGREIKFSSARFRFSPPPVLHAIFRFEHASSPPLSLSLSLTYLSISLSLARSLAILEISNEPFSFRIERCNHFLTMDLKIQWNLFDVSRHFDSIFFSSMNFFFLFFSNGLLD